MTAGFSVLVSVLAAAPLQARLLTVRADGSGDSRTLSEALEKAQSGDEVELSDTGRAGLEVKKDSEGLLVSRVLPGGAGEEAGLKVGDHILEIDGESIQSRTLPYAISRIAGKPGTQVRLTLEPAGSREHKWARLTRKAARLPITDAPSKLKAAQQAGDGRAALEQAKPLAKAGDASGMEYLAVAYADGTGVGKDPAEARRWAKTCAQTGRASCQALYGWLLASAEGEARDARAAVEWYKKAAAQDNGAAFFLLAEAYEKGQGVEADRSQALSWYEKAQAAGDPRAAEALKRLKPAGSAKPG